MKKVLGIYGNANRHWVGDGFPVRSLFSYWASITARSSCWTTPGLLISPPHSSAAA